MDPHAELQLRWASDGCESTGRICVAILCEESDPRPLSIAQTCTTWLPPLPTVESLQIGDFDGPLLDWKDEIEDDQWLEILRPFTAVKSLYLCEEYQQNMASSLQELFGSRMTEVLPSLEIIFLARFEPYFQEPIEQFIAARQLSGHPIAILPM